MARELAFVFINPYTIAKSRTGGVIARYIGRTELDLVGARMFSPSVQLVKQFAELVRKADDDNPHARKLLADYVLKSYAPDPLTNKPRRVMLLLFEGDNAIQRVSELTGSVAPNSGTGQTIRDTFGDYVLDAENRVQYFEPAVLIAPSRAEAADTLRLWARYSASDGGLVGTAVDVPRGEDVERTLVLLKPDNFRFRSFRPGNIIDLLSRSGLRIVAVKKFQMTVAQAEDFYGPVRQVLTERFDSIGGQRLAEAVSREFGIALPDATRRELCERIGPLFAEEQFESIVQFMTGYKPSECMKDEKGMRGKEPCFALVYEGHSAVSTIRQILGPTDPSRAEPGSVRKEFGSNIMVNAAHASDSAENAKREMAIIRVDEDTIKLWVERSYGPLFARVKAKFAASRGPEAVGFGSFGSKRKESGND